MKQNDRGRQALQKIFRMQCEICKAPGHPLRLAVVDRLKDGEAFAAARNAGRGDARNLMWRSSYDS